MPLAGIAGSLALVGALAASVVGLARLSGLASSEEISLVFVGTQGAVDPQGLLLAGMLIGVVGGLVDVTGGAVGGGVRVPRRRPRRLPARPLPAGDERRAGPTSRRPCTPSSSPTPARRLPMLLLFAMYASALGDIWNREMIVVEVVPGAGGVDHSPRRHASSPLRGE